MECLFALIPSHKFAAWLLSVIRSLFAALGLDHSYVPEEVAYLIVVIGIAIATGWVVQKVLVIVVGNAIAKKFPDISRELSVGKVLSHCGGMLPPLVLLSLIPFVFDGEQHATHIILDATVIYSVIMSTIAINSVFTFMWIHYNTHRNTKNLPLKGVVDVAQGIMWVVAVIVIVSIIVHKSPLGLLTGLGAFAAVLMLIFKNSILGLVAGVQLSLNDMLRVGDWIQVPGSDANGIVLDVSLVVVKVRNWNNTVTMLPPYRLVSDSFINWRCMKDTGSRQIEMSMPIDINTVRPLSDTELQDIATKVPTLKEYIDIKLKQRAEGKTANVFNKEAVYPGTIDTNLGLYRAYANMYVANHPYVDTNRKIMVRILQPSAYGFPLQVFCYLTTADWAGYEAILADIFEHLTAIAPTFALSVFEAPSARSVFNVGQNPQQGAPYYGSDPLSTPSEITSTPNPDSTTATPK